MSTIIDPVQALNAMSKSKLYYIIEYYFEEKDNMYFRCFESVEAIIQHIETNQLMMNGELVPIDYDGISIFHMDPNSLLHTPSSEIIESKTGIRLGYNDYIYIIPTIDGVSKRVIDYFRALITTT